MTTTTTTPPLALRTRHAFARLYAVAATLATTAGMVVLGVSMAVGLLVASVGTAHADSFVPGAKSLEAHPPAAHLYPSLGGEVRQ